MRLLIFPLTFIWALIRINPAKTIMIGVALWMFSYAGTIPDTKHEIKFFHQFELRGKWVGIYGDDFDAMAFDKAPNLSGPDAAAASSNMASIRPPNRFPETPISIVIARKEKYNALI